MSYIRRPTTGDADVMDEKVERAKDRVRRAFKRGGSFASKTAAAMKAGGNKQANLTALGEMSDDGEIATVGGLLRLVAGGSSS